MKHESESTAATRLLDRPAPYLVLDPLEIVRTVEVLRDRIDERFPGSGLASLAAMLVRVASRTVDQLRWVDQPHKPLRIGIGVLIVVVLTMLTTLFLIVGTTPDTNRLTLPSLLQMLESVMNDVFLIGASVFFLVTVEGRIKRRRALRFLRELRALAHIVDMHQLTKDPDRLLSGGSDTPSSPSRRMTRFELGRYLDYCSEMLSLISKIAALYVQNFDDPGVLAAVDEVETLTVGLSRKIWQKIMVLERVGTPAL
ncbi:MAG: hypothetical protein ACRENP_06380 [Longimicrobiales bacterium]